VKALNGEIWYDKIITDKYYSISNKLKKHTLENLENNLGDKMQIAVCDDQKVCLNILLENIKKCLDDLGKDYLDTIVDTYVSGESLIQAFKKGKSYDLIYLDIKMSNLNGFETAKVLRDIDNRVIIIFVTSLTDYIFNCFEYRPFWFITKPINEEKFKYVFFKAITAIRNSKTKEYSFFTRENGLISLELSKIIYLESVLRRIIIVTPTHQKLFNTPRDTSFNDLSRFIPDYSCIKYNR
jgi:DNA-binding LytR/AlgR family response regulator